MRLDQLKVIVTGGAQGMGAHFASRLSEAGAQVCVTDVNQSALDALPAAINRQAIDVSNEEQVTTFVKWSRRQMQGVNGLINNAGILRDGLLVKKDKITGDIVKLPTEQLRKVLEVNLIGATLMTREVVSVMVEDNVKSGVVINMSSIARHGNRGQSNYVAAKAALAANTVTWAREFAPFNIRVAAIAPGLIDTPMTQSMNPKALQAMVQNICCGRLGTPEDIYRAVQFIFECEYFNGRTLDVDGGLSL